MYFCTAKTLRTELAEGKEETDGLELFVAKVKAVTDVKELTPELVHQFISRIVIHEPYRANKRRHQQIDIYYRGVGLVHVPDPDEMERLFQESLTDSGRNENETREKNSKKEKTA